MKYAIIGCGRISRNHIAAALDTGLTISALCDLDHAQMKSIKEQFSLGDDVAEYTIYKEMLREIKPDIVAIATPSGSHAEIGLDTLDEGAHVIIEKPMALNLVDAQRLIEKSQEKDLRLCSCHQNRFNKSIQKIREALEAGRFGRLFHGAAHIRWNRGKNYYDQAQWRGTWAEDGGALMNQCIHNIDLLRWMMGGKIDEVMAYTDQLNHPYTEAEDLGLAILKFSNGSYGLIEGTTNVFPENLEETLYIFGEKGTAKAAGSSVNLLEVWNFADGLDEPEEVIQKHSEIPPNIYGFGHRPLYVDFISAVREKRNPYVDGIAGKEALELVLAIYLSAQTGAPVKLPLQQGDTLDFSGRFAK